VSTEKEKASLPMEDGRYEFNKLRSSIADLKLDNERMSSRVTQMEKEIKLQTERAEKAEAVMEQVLKKLTEIETSIKIANLLAKFVAWCSGLVLGIAGIWYSRHG
jgi:transcriptional regulator NrdR family protein